MTHSFNQNTIAPIDGFIYCIESEPSGERSAWTIANDPPGTIWLCPPFKMGTVDHKIIATNNPSLKDVPQLPELVNTVKDDDAVLKIISSFPEIRKAININGFGYSQIERDLAQAIHNHFSKKQFTLEDMKKAMQVLFADGYSYARSKFKPTEQEAEQERQKWIDDYIASLPKPVPKELTIDIDGDGNVTITHIKF